MKPSYLLVPLLLLLASCGVSSSKQESMATDFRNKFTALYLVPDAPGMVEDVEVYDFEKGDDFVDGAYRASFSASHIGDDGRSRIQGVVGFDENGRVAFRDSTHLAVRVLIIMDMAPARSVPSAEWKNYLPSQIPY